MILPGISASIRWAAAFPRKLGIFFIIGVSALSLWSVRASSSNPRLEGYVAEQKLIEDLREMPEEDLDIGMAALRLEKSVFSDLNLQNYEKKLTNLANRIQVLTGGSLDPNYRIKAINTVLFIEERFKYDHTFQTAPSHEHFYLHRLLDKKKGNCSALAALYLAIAARLNYPIYPVDVPQHVFLRYIGPDLTTYNIDPTMEGARLSDENYIQLHKFTPKALQKGIFMRTQTHREFLSNLFYTTSFIFRSKDDWVRYFSYLENAVYVNPYCYYAWTYLADVYEANMDIAPDPNLNRESIAKLRGWAKEYLSASSEGSQ